MSQQQIIVQPMGIITRPNKLGGIPTGAMLVADNTVMRTPGSLDVARAWSVTTDGSLGVFCDQSIIIPFGAYLIWIYRNAGSGAWFAFWNLQPASGTVYPLIQLAVGHPGYFESLNVNGRWDWATARNRLLLLCAQATLIFDYQAPASAAQATPRLAGLPPPKIQVLTAVTSASANALKDDTACHVVAIFRRTMADGYETVSAPSFPIHVGTTSGAADISTSVTFDQYIAFPGDVLEIYRTRAQAYSGTNGTNLGSDFYRSTSYKLTSSDITAGFVTLLDTSADTTLGESLYTNRGVLGPTASALPPPVAKCISVFRGHTFYSNYTTAAEIELRIPNYWGNMGDGTTGSPAPVRKNGFGRRVAAGTYTAASNVITGVSAVDIVGIVVGQTVTNAPPGASAMAGSRVTAVGASTITLSAASAGSGSGNFFIADVIELNGAAVNASTPDNFISLSPSIKLYVLGLGRVYPDAGSVGAGVSVETVPDSGFVITTLYQDSYPFSPNSFTIRATNGWNIDPRLPRIELGEAALTVSPETEKNGIYWSENEQPENCPGVNIDNVGKGEVYASVDTRDALTFFCDDGIWRLSGTGGDVGSGYDWRVDPVDKTFVIAGPQAFCRYREDIYAYGNRGFVVVDSGGSVTELSEPAIGDVLPGWSWFNGGAETAFLPGNSIYMIADELTGDITLKQTFGNSSDDKVWVYNVNSGCFTKTTPASGVATVHGAYSPSARSPAVTTANGTSLTTLRLLAPSGALLNSDTTFQPFFGDTPFTVHRWQQVDVSYDVTGGTAPAVQCFVNQSVDCGTRALVGSGQSIFQRTSFGIPRNAPAYANNIGVRLVTSFSATPSAMRLQGFSLSFESVSDQRKNK